MVSSVQTLALRELDWNMTLTNRRWMCKTDKETGSASGSTHAGHAIVSALYSIVIDEGK